MFKGNKGIKDDKQYYEKADPVVDRQSQSYLPPFSIIAIVLGVYLSFKFITNEQSAFDVIINTIQTEKTAFNIENYNSKPKSKITLHNVVKNGSLEEIKQQLLIDKTAVNEVVNGMTPTMLAASRGDVEIIDLLFAHGADPNKRGSMNRTALQYAAEKNHIAVAERLLSHGADIDAYDNGRLTPLIMAASRDYTELGLLLVERGADVNIQHVGGWTALIDATAHGDEKFVIALLNAGADRGLTANNGKNAMDYAKEYGFKNIEKILRD